MASMSYYHKPRSNPLEYHILHQILDKHAASNPDKECIVFYDANQQRTSLTYQQLKDQSTKFAASLLKLGFKRGDRILLYSTNSLEFVVCWVAMSRIGICVALKYSTDNEWEWLELMKRIKCTGAILGLEGIAEEQRKRLLNEISELARQEELGCSLVKFIITIRETAKTIDHPHILRYENLIDVDSNQPDVKQAESQVDPEDAAFVFFTSGTTSGAKDPSQLKSVAYTQHALINALRPIASTRSVGSFTANPMSWGSGFTLLIRKLLNCSTYVCTMYKNVTIKDKYQVMFDIIQAENLTMAGIPPQHIHQVVADKFFEKFDVSKITGWVFGSQLIHRTTIQTLLDALPQTSAVLLYASSETLSVAFQTYTAETVKKRDDFGKLNIVSNIEVKIIDDQGLLVPLGTKGQICVRGPKTFLEYLEDSAATMATKTPTGWVHTSDYGIMYDQGRLKVLGRKVDAIVTKDQTVFPIEVEEVLLESPDVQDVVVVGVPSTDETENICACIIEVPGSNLEGRVSELVAWCKAIFLKKHLELTPSFIVFLKSFPISNGGKINRSAVKEIAQKSHRYIL